jgi:hypothetical protein
MKIKSQPDCAYTVGLFFETKNVRVGLCSTFRLPLLD